MIMQTTTRFYTPFTLPSMDEFDFLLILGGPMSVNDETVYPWLTKEKWFIQKAIAAEKLILGICLGSQLIANAMGKPVFPNQEKEIGWHRVFARPRKDALIRFPAGFDAFHWHGETFELPDKATLLASSSACENQAYQIGQNIIGLQFHLETTPASVDLLLKSFGYELTKGAYIQTLSSIKNVRPINYQVINKLMVELLENFQKNYQYKTMNAA